MRATATVLLSAAALAGCLRDEQLDLDGDRGAGGPDTETEELVEPVLDGGVDLLFVVDDSISMREEQAMLETSVFALVNSLAHPFGADFPSPVDDLRAAVVSTNMGFSAGGESGDEHWPGDMVGSCQGLGDDGAFRASSEPTVAIESGAIPCADSALHCPPGWECAFGEACTGLCEPPVPGENDVACPGIGDTYAETSPEAPNGGLSLEVACLSALGTDGCGFEQQLASAVRAAAKDENAWFFRANAALGVLVVSDEDDCSMEDNAGLFATDEVADQGAMKINLACGAHPEFLFDPEDLLDALAAAKGGAEEAVFFAAIVGVPPGPACEGRGDAIGDCLLRPEMQLVPEELVSGWFFHPACTRSVGDVEVTRAFPGRRLVEVAQGFGERGYVYSICNDGWTAAMTAFAGVIGAAVE